MPYDDVMIDIETLSIRPNATIVSIGAIKFNRLGPLQKLESMDQFYVRVSRESCEILGSQTDKETIDWWAKQDEKVRYEALENPEDRLDIKEALIKLREWIGKSTIVWGHGDDFDCVVLNEAYRMCGQETPWKFWNTRDTRTVYDLSGIRITDLPPNDKHHPIHDCYRQISGLKMSFAKLDV
jgi:DNA polymerase III epsilon subunit-like protein